MARKRSKHNIWHYLLTTFRFFLNGLVSVILWLAVGLVGLLVFQTKRPPFDFVVGLPLLLAAAGFITHALWSAILSIFSLAFNKGSCKLCNSKEEE